MTALADSPANIECGEDALRALRIAAETYYHKPFATLVGCFELRAYQAARPVFNGPALDLGCNDGSFIHMLRRALNVSTPFVGIDVNDAALAAANHRHGACYSRLIRSAAESLPFDDGAFQTAVCNGMLQATDDPRRVLAELARVLAPGATICCTVPTPRWSEQYWLRKPLRMVGLRALERRYVGALDARLGHRHALPPVTWCAYFRESGFAIEHVAGCFPPDFVARWSVYAMSAFRVHGLLRLVPIRAVRSMAAAYQQALFARYFLRAPTTFGVDESGYILVKATRRN